MLGQRVFLGAFIVLAISLDGMQAGVQRIVGRYTVDINEQGQTLLAFDWGATEVVTEMLNAEHLPHSIVRCDRRKEQRVCWLRLSEEGKWLQAPPHIPEDLRKELEPQDVAELPLLLSAGDNDTTLEIRFRGRSAESLIRALN